LKAFLFPPEIKDGFHLQDTPAKPKPEQEKNDVIVLLNNLELDQMRVQESLEALVEELEKQRPAVIVVFGSFVSKRNAESMSFEEVQELLGYFGAIVRQEKGFLSEVTQWIFVPSQSDPAVIKTMPMPALAESLFKDFVGKRPDVIKHTAFGTNPCRLNYKGKEILLSRYNYFEALKKNHLAEQLAPLAQETEDSLKVARTIYYQQNLVPLP